MLFVGGDHLPAALSCMLECADDRAERTGDGCVLTRECGCAFTSTNSTFAPTNCAFASAKVPVYGPHPILHFVILV